MKGTDTKQVDYLYRGIMDYFSGMSGLDITIEQISARDKFIADSAIVCDDYLDEEVISLHDEFVSADGDPLKQKEIIERTIALLHPS